MVGGVGGGKLRFEQPLNTEDTISLAKGTPLPRPHFSDTIFKRS